MYHRVNDDMEGVNKLNGKQIELLLDTKVVSEILSSNRGV
jgi:hypothetical protein